MQLSAEAAEAIAKGSAVIRVKRAGTLQQVEFKVQRMRSPMGTYPVLLTEKFMDFSELVRIAEQFRLPVQAANATVFPRGTAAKDFTGLFSQV